MLLVIYTIIFIIITLCVVFAGFLFIMGIMFGITKRGIVLTIIKDNTLDPKYYSELLAILNRELKNSQIMEFTKKIPRKSKNKLEQIVPLVMEQCKDLRAHIYYYKIQPLLKSIEVKYESIEKPNKLN